MNESFPTLDNVIVHAYLNRGPYLDEFKKEDIFKSPLGTPYAFEIHASINGFYRYGSITFEDKFGIRESLPLTGNEIITIVYKNSIRGGEFTNSARVCHFNIFDIEETQTSADESTKFTDKAIKFHLIEAPFFLRYNDSIWTRSYGRAGKTNVEVTIDEIITEHLTEDLKLDKNGLITLDIGKMSTKTHFCCPAWKSQMMLSYLLDFARDQTNYGNVKLYNTSDNLGGVVVNLKSINQMFISAKSAIEYTLVDAFGFESGRGGESTLSARNINQILSHKFVSYDITSIPTGLPGGTLLTYDYLKSRYFKLHDTYEQSLNKKENKFFHQFALWSKKISNDKSKQFLNGQYKKEYAQAYLNNKIFEENKHQLRCQTLTYVNEEVQPGDKVFIIFMSGMTTVTRDSGKLVDEQMSGHWIVEEIVDATINGKGMRNMTLIRDSFLNLYSLSSGVESQPATPAVDAIKP